MKDSWLQFCCGISSSSVCTLDLQCTLDVNGCWLAGTAWGQHSTVKHAWHALIRDGVRRASGWWQYVYQPIQYYYTERRRIGQLPETTKRHSNSVVRLKPSDAKQNSWWSRREINPIWRMIYSCCCCYNRIQAITDDDCSNVM